MKYVILHCFFILHLCNIQICDSFSRHRVGHGRYYDINGFITQLLASKRFDELAEKLAEKAASRILNLKADQTHFDRAIDYNDTEMTKDDSPMPLQEADRNTAQTKTNKAFAGKIDPQAIMNQSILRTENLKLKYQYLKENARELKLKIQQEMASRNVTNVDQFKPNETLRVSSGDYTHENKTEEGIDKLNETQPIHNDVNINPIDEAEDDGHKIIPIEDNGHKIIPIEDNGHEIVPIEDNGHEIIPIEDNGHQIIPVEDNDHEIIPIEDNDPKKDPIGNSQGVASHNDMDNKEPEPKHVENAIKEEIATSLDEQNQHYVPSAEKNNAELDKTEEETQKQYTKDSTEFGNAVAYFRGRKEDVEENKVHTEADNPNPYGGVDKSVTNNESGNHGSKEQTPEEQGSRENVEEVPATPVERREGDKVYTYVQDPEYRDYHEEMTKWRKEHPENPADFL